MGKKKSGTSYTSKGIVGTTRSRKRHWEEGYQSDRITVSYTHLTLPTICSV